LFDQFKHLEKKLKI